MVFPTITAKVVQITVGGNQETMRSRLLALEVNDVRFSRTRKQKEEPEVYHNSRSEET